MIASAIVAIAALAVLIWREHDHQAHVRFLVEAAQAERHVLANRIQAPQVVPGLTMPAPSTDPPADLPDDLAAEWNAIGGFLAENTPESVNG